MIKLASRREFIGNVFSAGALILAGNVVPCLSNAELKTADSAWKPNVFVGINPDGSVIILAHRAEMGTGIRTTLPMVLADEMGADWQRVRVEQAVGNEKIYGLQHTAASCSLRDFYDTMRQAGAAARLMLERAASSHWNVGVTSCRVRSHEIVHVPTGRTISFSQILSVAARQPVPAENEIVLKSPAEFRYIGKGVPIVDLNDIVTGKAIYGFDACMPGMVYASIERPPVLGGKLRSFNDVETKKVSGVLETVVIEEGNPPYGFQALGGIAVIADNTWAASQGRKKLRVQWNLGKNAIFESAGYRESLIETAHKPQRVVRYGGDVEAGFKSAAKLIEATYYTPLLAHASMEPPAALAQYKEGKVTIWAATQNPAGVQDTVGQALGIKPEDVTCNVTLIGGAFGRKSKPDYVAEAAILSKKLGKPVKISWTREEDIKFDYYHAPAAMYFKAGVQADGRLSTWLQRSVFPPINSLFDEKEQYGEDELSMGFLDNPFDIPHFRAENGPAPAHVRIGWLRSVANLYHAFGIQSFMDECAYAAGKDPIEYWLNALGAPRIVDVSSQHAKLDSFVKTPQSYPLDTGKLRKVVEVVAEKSGWVHRKTGDGRAWGFAAHRAVLTYVAAVVEVQIDHSGTIRIPTVHMAVDCGQVIHPDRVKAQLEGSAVFGTSVALLGEITAADGRITQNNFNDYRVARMSGSPTKIYIHLVESGTLPTGVGEPGVPPMAPAICNAIFAATGKRIRELPVGKQTLI